MTPQTVKTETNLLIIEPDEATRSGMKRLLEMNGYSVSAAANEKEAEIAALQKTFDLILYDTNLPPPDSFSAAYKVHQNPKLRHISLIAISVHNHFGKLLENPDVDQFSVAYFSNISNFEELEFLTANLLNIKKNQFQF